LLRLPSNGCSAQRRSHAAKIASAPLIPGASGVGAICIDRLAKLGNPETFDWRCPGGKYRPYGLAKQAKTLTDKQIKRALAEVATHRYPERDRVMVLLSVKGGLRAKEIAMVTWGMVTDAGGNVGDALHLLERRQQGQERRPHGAPQRHSA